MLSAPLAMRIFGAGPAGSARCSLAIATHSRLGTPSSNFTLRQDRLYTCFENSQSAGPPRPPRNDLVVNWRTLGKQREVHSIRQRSCARGIALCPLQLLPLDLQSQSFSRSRLRERIVAAPTRSGSGYQIRSSCKGHVRNSSTSECNALSSHAFHEAGRASSRGRRRCSGGAFEEIRGRPLMLSRTWSRGLGILNTSSRSPSSQQAGVIAEEGQHNVGISPSTELEKEKFTEMEIIKPAKRLLTLPTILTLARVAAVPALVAVFYAKGAWTTPAGTIIFVVAALTDWLDGYLARKMGSISPFGALLDPVADKLMVAAALVLLCTRPLCVPEWAAFPWLLPVPTIAIIGREITMSAVREWAASQGGELHKAVAVSSLGKLKTASQMIAVTLLLLCGEGGLDSAPAAVVGVGLLYVAAGLALWSLRMYMKGIWGSMLK